MTKAAKDGGAALIMVLGLGLVMIVLISTGLTVASSGLRQAATEQNTVSALDAAYAGVQDYLARVNTDPAYVKYGNTAADPVFKNGSTLAAPPTPNPAFGVTDTVGWAPVPGSGERASFRYEVDNSKYSTSGFVNLRVTGRSGDRTRSLVVPLRVRGFVDYSYFTDFEIQDPDVWGATPAQKTACSKYAYAGRPTSGCYDLQFGKTDVFSGDVHSNDTLRVCGTQFLGTVTTANPTGAVVKPDSSCNNTGLTVVKADALSMPETNASMESDAGCLYTGPTQVTYNGDGTMTVKSPWTKFTRVSGTSGTNPPECGSLSGLQSNSGATIAELDNDLMYVQNVPSIAADPNSWTAADRPDGLSCTATDGSASTSGDGPGWIFTKGAGSSRYPAVDESPATYFTNGAFPGAKWTTSSPAYGCRNGDAFVKGTVTSRMTIASENYIYVVGDIGYQDKNDDVLGLVGQNPVFIWNPMKYTGKDAGGGDLFTPLNGASNREVAAAIISVAHTFQVQNFDRGSSRGALSLYGSIAQKYRGATRSVDSDGNATGYTKSYAYDPKLKTVSPPKFLSSTSARFQVTRYATVPSAYSSTGKKQ